MNLIYWVVLGGLLGAVMGSFAGTVIRRWPRGQSALAGRSHCESCRATLGIADLVPVFSYVARRGRCGHCGAAIDREHLMIELASIAIGIAALAILPGAAGVALAAMGWLLLMLGWTDAKALWLPDPLVLVLAILGLGVGGLVTGETLEARLIGGVAGFAVLALVRLAYMRLRGQEGMGGGDPKLMGAIGLWSGWTMLAPIVLVASATMLAAALATGTHRDTAHKYPLGTGLSAAAFLVTCLQAARVL